MAGDYRRRNLCRAVDRRSEGDEGDAEIAVPRIRSSLGGRYHSPRRHRQSDRCSFCDTRRGRSIIYDLVELSCGQWSVCNWRGLLRWKNYGPVDARFDAVDFGWRPCDAFPYQGKAYDDLLSCPQHSSLLFDFCSKAYIYQGKLLVDNTYG